jgi:hypothetical protein
MTTYEWACPRRFVLGTNSWANQSHPLRFRPRYGLIVNNSEFEPAAPHWFWLFVAVTEPAVVVSFALAGLYT